MLLVFNIGTLEQEIEHFDLATVVGGTHKLSKKVSFFTAALKKINAMTMTNRNSL
jgi:hypothetical protein